MAPATKAISRTSLRQGLVILGSILALSWAQPEPLAARQTAVSPSHEQAALELLEVMDLQAQYRINLDLMLDQPNMAGTPMAQALREFHDRYMSWEVVRPALVQIYAEAFSESEVRELIAFYRTPIGRKLVERTPALTRGIADVMNRIVLEHQTELMEIMQKAMMGGRP